MLPDIQEDLQRRMKHSVEVIAEELSAIRTGRASADMLKPVQVDYYGQSTPLQQLASFSTPDSQLIVVQPFDPSSAKAIEKAINASALGLNCSVDGSVIRVPVPVLTEERRKDLVKYVRKLGEDGRIAIRNIRRDANEHVKKLEKDKQISQDDERAAEEQIQSETDTHIKQIDELVKDKEQELMTV